MWIAPAVAGFAAVSLFLLFNEPWLSAGRWRDEAGSVYVASAHSISDFFSRCARVDYSPPLFNGILALWGRLAGLGPSSLAVFTVVVGVLATAAVVWAAGAIAGPWAGLFAVLFLLDGDIVFSEFWQVRPYMLCVGAAGLCAACLTRLNARMNSAGRARGAGIALSGGFAVLALSHYAGTVAVVAIAFVAVLRALAGRAERRAFYARVAAASVPAGALFALWIPAFLRQRRLGVPWDPGGPAARVLRILGSIRMMLPAFGPHGRSADLLPTLVVLVAGVFVWRSLADRWRPTSAPVVLMVSGGAAVLGVMGWSGGASRYVIVAAAYAAILFAATAVFVGRSLFARGARPGLVIGLGAILALGPIWAEVYRRVESRIGERPPTRSGIARIAELPDFDRDAIFIAAPNYLARTLWYYGVPEKNLVAFPPIESIADTEYSVDDPVWLDPAAVARLLSNARTEAARRGIGRIYVVTSGDPMPKVSRTVGEVLSGAARAFVAEKRGIFHGYPETVEVAVFELRSKQETEPRPAGQPPPRGARW